MEQHAAKPLLRIDLFSCVLISVSCVFLYNKRRKPIVDCRDDGRLEDVNMNNRGLLSPRTLTSAQYWRLQRRESATWIHQTIFVQFKDRRCSASLQTPFFALSIFPRVQEPAAIRPCGLRVFQTHYQEDKKSASPLGCGKASLSCGESGLARIFLRFLCCCRRHWDCAGFYGTISNYCRLSGSCLCRFRK